MLRNKIYIRQTENNKGKGIFAKTNIKKNEIVFIIKGKVKKEKKYYPGDYYKEGPRWLAVDKFTWLIPFRDNPWWYINHSCIPNAIIRGKNKIVAMKNIKKNEEITIDYSTTEDDPYWKMKCKCGNKECRKTIRSIRYLPKSIFDRYRNYIPRFLVKSYNKNKKV